MKIDKSITCVNIEREVKAKKKERLIRNGNNSNYNGLNELHETTMSSNNITYRNHNTTMNNCYQRYSQPISSSLIDSASSQHNKLKSKKKMYQYDYEQQQQHSQLKVMLTKNKSFNDLIKPYTVFERRTKVSTLSVVPYVNNKSFHCGNIIYPVSNVDYLKTEQMKRINTLLFGINNNNNILNLRKNCNQI